MSVRKQRLLRAGRGIGDAGTLTSTVTDGTPRDGRQITVTGAQRRALYINIAKFHLSGRSVHYARWNYGTWRFSRVSGSRRGARRGRRREEEELKEVGASGALRKDLGDQVTAAATGASLTQLGFSTMGNPGNPVFSDKPMTGLLASNGELTGTDSDAERHFGNRFGYGTKRGTAWKAWSSRGPGVQCTPRRLAFGQGGSGQSARGDFGFPEWRIIMENNGERVAGGGTAETNHGDKE